MNALGSKFKVTVGVGPTWWKMHFLASLTRCIKNYRTEFHQTFSSDAFWDKGFLGLKDQRSRSQRDQGPSGRKHTELNAVRGVLIVSRVFVFCGANYKKILRLSYDVIITYDDRKSNLR